MDRYTTYKLQLSSCAAQKSDLPKLFIDVTALNDDASHVGGNVCPARTWRAPGTLPFY